jgi:putative FmdB family regulatory protein
MPTYEFRCPTCETTFEEQRPMAQSGDPATCPAGHEGARRLLSVFANTSGSTDSLRAGAASPIATSPGGGCCGGGCGGH